MTLEIRTKRIYDPAAPADGIRVLVDRVWPRGIRKDEAMIVAWLKEIAPSTALRQWFGHRPERWKGFLHRYAQELDRDQAAVAGLRELMKKDGRVTLLFAARDMDHNNAVALAQYLRGRRI